MKRFQSPLLKIHDVCSQQSRLARIELARAATVRELARQRERQFEAAFEQARQESAAAMRRPGQTSLLQGILNHVAAAAEKLDTARRNVLVADQQVEKARMAYQAAHSKAERVSRLLEGQRETYRREQLREQQHQMDERAAARWVHPATGEVR
jgi:flagellar export protein FliJ